MNLFVIFFTGLTVGGLTCLAVQGGLLGSLIAVKKTDDTKQNNVVIIGTFLTAKLIAYGLLGFILGAFGGLINISSQIQTIMQLAAGIYMLLIALNLLDIHPVFRYAVIQPPKSLARLVRNQSHSRASFAPLLLGAMTIFIPCGTTLAMETLAISSGNAVSGALIMISFILGTIPLFFGIGYITSLLSGISKTWFIRIAAILIIYLGITSTNGALVALGSPVNLNILSDVFKEVSGTANTSSASNQTTQEVEIVITSQGYSPNDIKVKNGIPVTLHLTSKDAYSCASAFRIPSLGIRKNLKANETQTITFTPTQTGKIPFSCSMGMYTGVIEVL